MLHFTHARRRLFHIFQQLRVPAQLDYTWYSQSTVVYMRVHQSSSSCYIGATDKRVFDREQTRWRNYGQLDNQTLALYEPALKLWRKQGSFYQGVIIPVQDTSPEKLFVMETALQKEYKPVLIGRGSIRC